MRSTSRCTSQMCSRMISSRSSGCETFRQATTVPGTTPSITSPPSSIASTAAYDEDIAMEQSLPTCTTLAECNARDGARIAVVGVYLHYPDLPGFDYSEAPRAVRIQLEDALG